MNKEMNYWIVTEADENYEAFYGTEEELLKHISDNYYVEDYEVCVFTTPPIYVSVETTRTLKLGED